jgi:glycopeptide antibiotics resistance protein
MLESLFVLLVQSFKKVITLYLGILVLLCFEFLQNHLNWSIYNNNDNN